MRIFLANREIWKRRIKTFLSQDAHPGQIAAGLAVGVFIGCTPLYGLQTLTALGVAFLFRLNKPACIAGLWIQNPLTLIPLVGISYKLGCLTLGLPVSELSLKTVDLRLLGHCAEPFLLGSVVTGLIAAVPAYLISYFLIRVVRGDARN
jgi:uncharacterized protein (TIGR03546 family)